MARTITAKASPIIDFSQAVNNAIAPFKEVAERAASKADTALFNVGSVEQGLEVAKRDIVSNTSLGNEAKDKAFNALSVGQKAELDAGLAKRDASEAIAKNIEIGQDLGTLDARLQGEVANIRKAELDALSAKRTADLAEQYALDNKSKIGSLGDDLRRIGGEVKDVAGKVGGLALNVLDIVDKVANIFSLIAFLGSIARMEQIARNSQDRDAELQNRIDDLAGQLSSIINGLKDANGKITVNQKDIDALEGQLVSLQSGINALLTNTSALLTGQNSIQSNITQTRNKVDTSISQNTLIKKDTEYLLTLTNEIPNRIIPQIRPQVCLALKDPNCNSGMGSGGGECDLSGVESALSDINSKLGIFPFNCTTEQPSNGFYNSISQALQGVVCGGSGNSGFSKTLKDIFDEKDRTDEILDAVELVDKQVNSLYLNQDNVASLLVLNAGLGLHNACRLSWEPMGYINLAVDEIETISMSFTDKDGISKTLSQWVGNSLENLDIIPPNFADRANDDWLESSVNIVGMANLNCTINDATEQLLNVTELTLDRLSIWMNTARSEGLVKDKAYPYCSLILTKSRYERYSNFVDAINALDIEYNPENVGALTEDDKHTRLMAQSLPALTAERDEVKAVRLALVTNVKGRVASELASDDESLLDNEAPETLVSAKDFMEFT